MKKSALYAILIALLVLLSACYKPFQIERLKSYVPAEALSGIEEDFFTDYGLRDWWRLPLVYPYEIQCVDVLDYGVLAIYKAQDLHRGYKLIDDVFYIRRFVFDRDYLLAMICDKNMFSLPETQPVTRWIIFNFSQGKVIAKYADEKSMLVKAKALGFKEGLRLISVREYYNSL